MPARINFCHTGFSSKMPSARRTVVRSASPLYSANLKPVPLPLRPSKDSMVSSKPPVARTIGTVPYFKL